MVLLLELQGIERFRWQESCTVELHRARRVCVWRFGEPVLLTRLAVIGRADVASLTIGGNEQLVVPAPGEALTEAFNRGRGLELDTAEADDEITITLESRQ